MSLADFGSSCYTFLMNAFVCLFILNTLVLRGWVGQNALRAWLDATQRCLRRLESREYHDSSAEGSVFHALFQEQLRSGRLHPQALRSLLTWIRKLEQADRERLQVGYGAALRLGVAAGLGLAVSLLLDGHWFLRWADNPPVLLLFCGYVGILGLWLRRLPAHPLAQSSALQAQFTQAWLGQSRGGPWHASWVKCQERGRLSGRDGREEQTQILEDWLLLAAQEQEKRLTWADELFGLVELASSVYFLGTACTLPLLNLWG